MTGSALFAVITFVVLFVVGIFFSPWFIIPALVIGAFALLSAPLFGALKGGRRGPGTPSTSEASYDPAGSGSDRPI